MALFDFLASNRSTEQKLIEAVLSNDVELLRTLLEDGVDLSKKVYKYGGDTALHLAAFKGKTSVIEYLIHAGVNCELQNDSGITPLYNAVRASQCSAVKLLLKHCRSDAYLNVIWIEDGENYSINMPHNIEMRIVEIISAPNLLFHETLWNQIFAVCEHAILANDRSMKLLFLTSFKCPNATFLKYMDMTVKQAENIEKINYWELQSEHDKLTNKKKSNDILELLQNMKKNPLSLAHLCRLTIRWSFWNKCNVFYGVEQLPLPTGLKEYLVFDGQY